MGATQAVLLRTDGIESTHQEPQTLPVLLYEEISSEYKVKPEMMGTIQTQQAVNLIDQELYLVTLAQVETILSLTFVLPPVETELL